MKTGSVKRHAGVLALAALALVLTACMLMPGSFASQLDIRKNGDFRFRYSGELIFLPLAEKPKEAAKFTPETCYDDDYEERACTAAELAEQKAKWQKEQAGKADRERQEAESAKAFLGGIDPSDPKSAMELADRLRRQAGWKRVDYRGNGVFDVDVEIVSSLDHDFVFPTLERFSMANAFVQISRRADGTVRIDAPGFGPAAGPMGLGAMMQSAAPEGVKVSGSGSAPTKNGHFTIRTDAAILANNTDEGPGPDPAGSRLDWKVTAGTQAAPTALIQLAP